MTAETIIDVFMYIFEAWVFGVYASLISSPKKSFSIRFFSICIGYFILLLFYKTENLLLIGTSVFIVCTILFSKLYEISLKRAIFHSIVLLVVMVLSEVIVMGLVSIFANASFDINNIGTIIYLIDVTISKLAYMAIALLIAQFFAMRENREQNTKPYWFMSIMPISSIVMMAVIRNISIDYSVSPKTYVVWIVSAFLVLFSNIIIYIIFEKAQKEAIELSDLKVIQQHKENDKRYFEIIEQSNKEMQVFAHDIKNHLIQIRNMDNNDSIKNYIDKLYPQLETFSFVGISDNKMLDLILSKYITLCERKNIKFCIDVKTANLSYVSETDLSTLLNNLLDNSVEAAERSVHKKIELKLSSKSKNYDTLLITNSCESAPIISGDHLITTKKDKKFHGIGLKSIEKIIKKYNGVYNWAYNDEKKEFETLIGFTKH